MAVAVAGQSPLRSRKRSFFFALSADQKQLLITGNSKERLTLRMLSLGFGARDEVHLLEAEGAKGDGESDKIMSQTRTMVRVQPSLPAVAFPNTVLTPPVTFKLRSGPGPLYVSGSRLVSVEEDSPLAPVMASAKIQTKTDDEPALKRPTVSPGVHLQTFMRVTAPLMCPSFTTKNHVKAISKYLSEMSSRSIPAVISNPEKISIPAAIYKPAKLSSKPAKEDQGAQVQTCHLEISPEEVRRRLEKVKEVTETLKAKIMEDMVKGVTLSRLPSRFERFLKHSYKMTDPYVITELWKWRQTLK